MVNGMHKASFQEIAECEHKRVRCLLCPHRCVIDPDKTGLCKVRVNQHGILCSLVYGKHTSVALDPIEKKPLYHFHPGTEILSFGTIGCNLSCAFCQNWEISQADFSGKTLRDVPPEDTYRMIREYHAIGAAYTYNEPFTNYEWVFDTAKILYHDGAKNVLVTNGYVNEEPLLKMVPFIHAANVDVKSFHNEFYHKICGGSIGPVLRTVEILVKKKVHIEITALIVPGENDRAEHMRDMVDWLSALDPFIPLHLSRY
jgi:pyruvate formate lyase activating enzyme